MSSKPSSTTLKSKWSREVDGENVNPKEYIIPPQVVLDTFTQYDDRYCNKHRNFVGRVKVIEYYVEPATKTGENYFSNIYRLVVKCVRPGEATGPAKAIAMPHYEFQLIIKMMPSDSLRAQAANQLGLFVKEHVMYSKVLPEMLLFQRGQGVNARHMWYGHAEYYGSFADGKDGYVVLQDLHEMGYALARGGVITPAHVALVMESFGKFHAVSYVQYKGDYHAMLKKFPELEEREWGPPDSPAVKIAAGAVGSIIQAIMADLKAAGYTEEAEVLGRPEFTIESISKRMYELVGAAVPKYAIIGHGDPWMNNMFFNRRQDDLMSVLLIDFQCARVCSRVLDLLYFLLSHTNADEESELKYLRMYYDAFAEHASRLGYFDGETLTFEQLVEEYNAHRVYGVYSSLVIIQVAYSDKQKAIDPTKMFCSDDSGNIDGKVKRLFEEGGNSLVLEKVRNLIKVQLPKLKF